MSHFLALAMMKKANLLEAISGEVGEKHQLSKRDPEANETGLC